MNDLRRWQLSAAHPYTLEIAADARLSSTDYLDDQVWRLSLGAGESPALALQTQYGGRVGLASLVPMWLLDNRTLYQAQGYAKPPVITAFAPGYVQAQAGLTPRLAVRAEYWAMESHAVGARFTLANNDTKSITVRLDLFAHVILNNKELQSANLPVTGNNVALLPGRVGNLNPAIVIEGGQAAQDAVSPRIGVTLSVPANGKASVRWVHAGLRSPEQSAALALKWLNANWTDAFAQIAQAAQAIPAVETSDVNLDAAIAFAYHQLVQAFLRPSASLPHPSFVASRQPDRGFSKRGDGSDYIRSWNGQAPTMAYLAALGVAPIAPELAQGVILNYLAVQQDDGSIDWKPGLGGQRQGMLSLPILARLAWGIFQYTEDEAFLRAAFPGLLKFFHRWLASDLDKDGDGIPEWQYETQTGYPYFPTFAVTQGWGQGADIRTVESPDLVTYLLSEAVSLREMAYFLRDDANEKTLSTHIDKLKTALESLWRDNRYAYRDRDTHATTGSVVVVDSAPGDEQQFPALPISPANRVVVRITGGWEHVPAVTLHIEGTDANGQPAHETASADALVWMTGRGTYTSRAAFSQVDRLWIDDLIRPYKFSAHTLDTTRIDLNAVLPLWSVGMPPERTDSLVALLTDPAHFWRANGVTMVSTQDSQFDPANERGGGGIWTYWLTLIGEGLIESGRDAQAAEMLQRLLKAQVAVLTAQKEFSEFYHSDEPRGLGERGNLAGIMPLHLLLRVLGVRVVSPGKVWTGGAFAWGSPVTIRQHGVEIRRTDEGTSIKFPSGHTVDFPADAAWQEVVDPGYKRATPASTGQSAPEDLFDS